MRDKNNTDKGAEPSKLEKFVRGCVRNRQYEIIIGKKKQFTIHQIKKPATAIFFRENKAKFEVVVYNYFRKYRNYWSTKFSRINKNKDLLALQEKYENVNINLLAKYLSFKGKFELQKKSDIQILEDIIKIIYWIPLYDKTATPLSDEEEVALIIKEYQELEVQQNKIQKEILNSKKENEDD